MPEQQQQHVSPAWQRDSQCPSLTHFAVYHDNHLWNCSSDVAKGTNVAFLRFISQVFALHHVFFYQHVESIASWNILVGSHKHKAKCGLFFPESATVSGSYDSPLLSSRKDGRVVEWEQYG